jgi:hypothetical protein
MISLSGSDHRRSHSSPVSGTSVGRSTLLICSREASSGDKPNGQQVGIRYIYIYVKTQARTSVHAQNLLVHKSSNRKTVKTICEGLPQLYTISSLTYTHIYITLMLVCGSATRINLTFVIKTIYPIDRSTFMITCALHTSLLINTYLYNTPLCNIYIYYLLI